MSEKSLIQFILDLLKDPQALADFKANPQSALNACGLSGVTPEDVHDALVIVGDNDDVSFDRDYHTGGNHIGGASVPPPPPPAPHENPAHYLDKYITNNYVTNNIDDRDTIVDNSVNQNIHAGGDVNQSFDNHSVTASGDGAVAAGGNIDHSTITTGNGNVVGHGNNVVNGDDNTTAFGHGSAVRDVSVDHGSGFSVNGDASGNASTNDSFNKTSVQDNDTTKIDDSFNHSDDHSVDTHVDDHSTHHLLSDNQADIHVAH